MRPFKSLEVAAIIDLALDETITDDTVHWAWVSSRVAVYGKKM